MHIVAHRTNTLKWLESSVTNFQSNDDPNNLALFSFMGPPDIRLMQILFSSLRGRVLILPYHQIIFVLSSGVLLVCIHQHSESDLVTPKARILFDIMDVWRAAFMILDQHDFQCLGLVPIQKQRALQ